MKKMECRLTVHKAEIIEWLIAQRVAVLLELGVKLCGQIIRLLCTDGDFENAFAREDT